MFKTIQFAVLIQLPFSMTLLCMDHTRTLSQRVLPEPYVWNILTQKDSYFTHATPVSKLPRLQMTPHIRSLIYLFTLSSSMQALPRRKTCHLTNLEKSSRAFDPKSNLLNPQLPILSANDELKRLQVLMIVKDDREALTRILNHGVNGAGFSKESLLCLATRSGRYELAEMLLEAGADCNKASMSGKSPLLFAANNGNTRLVRLLLAAGADKDKADNTKGQTPLFRAAFNNHKDVAVLLIQAGAILAKADSCGSTALDVALDRAHIDTITLLVQAGEGARQLLSAAVAGDTLKVRLLLNAGVALETVDSKRETALYKAAMNGREEMVGQLLAAGAKHTQAANGATPLFIAAMHGHKRVVSRLLRAGANVDISTLYGETPLFVAARFGHSDVVGLLL